MYQEQAKVFKAFCDPKRLAILEQLRSGEKCACVLLDSRQEGKWTHYRLSAAGRDHALRLLEQLTTPNTGAPAQSCGCGQDAI